MEYGKSWNKTAKQWKGHRDRYIDSFIIGIYLEHNLILFESA